MLRVENHFGKASKELEHFVSQHRDGIKSVLENQINASHFPNRFQARYNHFATWEIVSSPDPNANQEGGQAHEKVVLDLFFNTSFCTGGNYKQLIIRHYKAGT